VPERAASDRRANGWVAGHRGTGARPFAGFAGGTAQHGWVGAGPQAGRLAHGVSHAGLVVALDADPDAPGLNGVVQRVLDSASDAAGARELLLGEWGRASIEPPRPVVSVLSGDEGWRVELGRGGPPARQLTPGAPATGSAFSYTLWRGPRTPGEVEARLRRSRPGGTLYDRSLLIAGHAPGGPLTVLLGLGSAISAIPLRVWPGHIVGPPAGAVEAATSRLGGLAEAVDTLVTRGTLTEAAVREALGAAGAAALAEGDDAERQAQLMDSHGDDAGAAVRRLVAQTYAGGLAEAALRALVDRESAGPSL
jgi:hypothetical protein